MRVLILLLALGAIFVPSASATTTVTVPDSIPHAYERDVTTDLESFFGTVPNDAIINFPTNGRYRVDDTIDLANRYSLDFEGHGSIFRAFTEGNSQRAHWRLISGGSYIFHNLTVVGSKPTNVGYTPASQWQHGFDLRSVGGATLNQVDIRDVYGDAVYVGRDAALGWSANVLVENGQLKRIGRNAISVVAGYGVTGTNLAISSVGYDVFDVEPNSSVDGATNILFASNAVTGPIPQTLLAVFGSVAPVDGVTLDHTTLTSGAAYIAALASSSQPIKNLLITNNTADTALTGHGAVVDLAHIFSGELASNSLPTTSYAGINYCDVAEAFFFHASDFPGASVYSQEYAPCP